MAQVLPGKGAVDLGNGLAASFYDDGTVQVWNIGTGQLVTTVNQGDYSYDLGTGQAATMGAGGQFSVYDIGGQANPYGYQPYSLNLAAPALTGAVGGTAGGGGGGGSTGYVNWGMTPVNILQEYQQYLSNPTVAPGYIPGSGSYNQWLLSQPGLFNQINGIPYNQQYGSGGAGDPGSGAVNDLTLWREGDRLFNWPSANLENEYSPIGNMFLRSDTSSGLGTTTLGAAEKQWMAPLLLQAITSGRITPTDRGKQFLQQVFGIAPQQYGNVGGGTIAGTTVAGGGGGGGAGGNTALQDYMASIQAMEQAKLAAQLAYQDWYMRTQDDEQAFQHAQQEYENKFNEQMFAYQQKKDVWSLEQSAGYFTLDGNRVPTLAGIAQEAALTGQYQGKPTFQREQYESGVMQNLLSLQAGLRGPENYAQYLKVLGSTPQGMRDVVNAAAGRFQLPSTAGSAGQTNAADVQSLLRDVTSGGAQAQADWTAALSGGLPAPNQISIQNWSKMLPTQQKMLLSAYEGSGWDPNDVYAQIQKASPVGAVGGGSAGTYRF